MKKSQIKILYLFFALLVLIFTGLIYTDISSSNQKLESNVCVECHLKPELTPLLVKDWQESLHSKAGITCDICHGNDPENVKFPTPETCGECHPERVEQYKKGKHALAWIAMNAMPATHYQPMELIEGKKGCGGCHKIGLKTPEEIKKMKLEGLRFGVASCDACHTRHTFSVKEAKEPEACSTCHMGFDHPQWEMWSKSKHGVRYLLNPENPAAPTCQTCHMKKGNHEVRTAWGFLAIRLPMPADEQWAKDRTVILKALGVLDPDGNPTERLDAVKAADVARLDQESWEKERNEMISICSQCHSSKFAKGELEKGDEIIRQADRLLAEAIQTVVDLYKDKIIKKPENYIYSYPDLLYFHESPTLIEQRLFRMFLEHRMRAFQGAFHANPDYAFWYGWAEMRSDLIEIKYIAEELRNKK